MKICHNYLQNALLPYTVEWWLVANICYYVWLHVLSEECVYFICIILLMKCSYALYFSYCFVHGGFAAKVYILTQILQLLSINIAYIINRHKIYQIGTFLCLHYVINVSRWWMYFKLVYSNHILKSYIFISNYLNVVTFVCFE
jgi:hypothetical protein